MDKNKKTILLTGGGTMGPVAPLLGIYQELRGSGNFSFVWIGTRKGPEKEVVESFDVKFVPIFSGKLRRYFSFENVKDVFRILLAFFQSFYLIIKYRPSLIISAGAYVSVSIVWTAWLFRVPVLIHQQDARPGLANKLMAFFAKKITTTFESSVNDYGKKAIWVGNSVRREFVDVRIGPREARQKTNLSQSPEVVLVLGGGTGASKINDLVTEALSELTKFCQVLHITGKGKMDKRIQNNLMQNPNYRAFEFIDTFGMIKAFSASDMVVSRCGMSTLTEISYLAKPAILIPMPDTHQEDNATVFEGKGAAIVLKQKELSREEFIKNIRNLIKDEDLRNRLGDKAKTVIKTDANKLIAEIILKMIKY